MEEPIKRIPLDFDRLTEDLMEKRSVLALERFAARRTVRHFSPDAVPLSVVHRCIQAAATSPSGAHKQPWSFCLVTNPEIKKAIREAAEKEEYDNYHGRMPNRWLEDLKPFDTNHLKPHLEEAPALIVVFRHAWQQNSDSSGGKRPNYYVQESVGIACGFLLAALHECGIASLTHTPSPMDFLVKILGRPEHERAYLLIPIGYPAKECQVPDLQRKKIDEVLFEYK